MIKTPPVPGIYFNVPFEQYLAIDAVNNSTLKWGQKSCLHMQAAQLGLMDKDTDAKRLGRKLHTAIFEPLAYKRIPISPFKEFRTDEAKLWKKATPDYLTTKDVEQIAAIVKAIYSHPQAKKLLSQDGGKGEATVVCKDEATGLFLKARVDFLGMAVVDGKSTVDANPHEYGFPRQAGLYGYHQQEAFYRRVLQGAKYKFTGFVFLAFEKELPYPVTTMELDAMSVDKGAQEVERLLQLYKECKESGSWPGYSDKLEPVTIPKWALQARPFESAEGYVLEEAA